MKRLVCEMCNSSDLVKQDGMFICQHCGCKYTVEEAKKLFIEGKVTINNDEKLNGLYAAARRARDMGSYTQAAEYYKEILTMDVNNWEPNFYSVFCDSMEIRVYQIDGTWIKLNDCFLDVVARLMQDYLKKTLAEDTVKQAVNEISGSIQSFVEAVYSTCHSNYVKDWPNIPRSRIQEHVLRVVTIVTGVSNMGYKIGDGFSQLGGMPEEEAYELATPLWKLSNSLAVKFCNDMKKLATGSNFSVAFIDTVNKVTESIKKYDPDYVPPEFTGSTNSSANTSSGGCYVATAIYGSYDCPQVWTLRRFRDFTLAETWYGRAFIRIYYAISPSFVKWFGHMGWFKKMWKGKLDRMVDKLNASGVANTPYKDRTW